MGPSTYGLHLQRKHWWFAGVNDDVRQALVEEVATLGGIPRSDLVALWERAYGHPPPKGIRHELLLRSASWHLQAKRLRGLSPSTKRLLRSAIADAEQSLLEKASIVSPKHCGSDSLGHSQLKDEVGRSTNDPEHVPQTPRRLRSSVSPGDRLVRDWNGKTYIVDVIEEGFVFQAKVHKSLTGIARQITGAHWSGPRFFGL